MIDPDGSRANLLADDHPTHGIAHPLTSDDVVDAAVLLASDEASYTAAPPTSPSYVPGAATGSATWSSASPPPTSTPWPPWPGR
nr:hypothetical protein [Streptomyces olivaceoviridis]